MINFFKKVGADIVAGRNLEHYITIAFILVILGLDIFNLASPDIVTEITLAVLALVVLTSLNTRDSLNQVQESLDKQLSADEFFWSDKRSLENDIEQARYIGFVGTTLSRTVRDYSAIVERKLKQGAEVRFIIIDPDSTAPDQAVLRSKGVINRQFYIDLLRPTLERICALSYSSQGISLGLLPYKPTFGMIILDPDESRGRIIVEMYPHRSTDLFPTFELTPNRDSYWFKHFQKQFKILWESCDNRTWQGDAIQDFVTALREQAN